jgi:hypothetical protein
MKGCATAAPAGPVVGELPRSIRAIPKAYDFPIFYAIRVDGSASQCAAVLNV